jgi:hypothetical protein
VQFLDPDPRIQRDPKFTPDGKAVVYVVREKGTDNLWRHPLDGSPGRQLTNFQADWTRAYEFSPDGRTRCPSSTSSDSVLFLRSQGRPIEHAAITSGLGRDCTSLPFGWTELREDFVWRERAVFRQQELL